MTRIPALRTLAIAGLVAFGSAAFPVAAIDVDFDIAAGMSLSDDTRLFVNLSNNHYGPNPDVALTVLRKVPNPGNDFPVLLFLAAESGKSIEILWSMRRSGLTWAEVQFRAGVPTARIFAGLDNDPGPPYGKAWGHWKNKGKGKGHTSGVHLSDTEFVNLVKVQITSKHFGLSPHEVIRAQSSGKKVEAFAREHHYNRGGKKPSGTTKKSSNPGKGKGKKK